jgi:hypothetical protein
LHEIRVTCHIVNGLVTSSFSKPELRDRLNGSVLYKNSKSLITEKSIVEVNRQFGGICALRFIEPIDLQHFKQL